MITSTWDSPTVYAHLIDLQLRQVRSRLMAGLRRAASPKRVIATAVSIVCFVVFTVGAVTVLAEREPVGPQQLELWLGGSMVLYSLYHFSRQVWVREGLDAELTDAARLWIAGAPVQRSSVLMYPLLNAATGAVIKTSLLAFILVHDVARIELFLIAMCCGVLLLEIVRRVIDRVIALLSPVSLVLCRFAVAIAVLSLLITIGTSATHSVPLHSPTSMYLIASLRSLGEVASSPLVQALATPWHITSALATSGAYSPMTMVQLVGCLCLLLLGILILVFTDREAIARQHRNSSIKLLSNRNEKKALINLFRFDALDRLSSYWPTTIRLAVPLALRQFHTLLQHALTVAVTLLLPTLLSLSPLLIDTTTEQWLFVVGGVTLSTMLLAPPALRLDFRRDLRRMSILSGLPLAPRTVVIGQLLVPVSLTIAFQLIVLTPAAWITNQNVMQTVLWMGILPAFAVMVFAAENAIFLDFPHQERAQGITMLIRTKVIFIVKAATLLTLLGLLLSWATVLRLMFPGSLVPPLFVFSSIAAAAALAWITLGWTARAWTRFELTEQV